MHRTTDALPRRRDTAAKAKRGGPQPRAHDPRCRNQLLQLLAPEVLARLTPHLEPVHLERKEVLFRAYEPLRVVYFPDCFGRLVRLATRVGRVGQVGGRIWHGLEVG